MINTEVITTAASKTKRVLIIDDERSAREGLSELVQSWGYTTTTAKDGQEAIEIINSFHPDLIICDLVMPKMDGITMLKKIRQHSDAMAIILTAQGSIDSAVEAIKEGACDYLTKPIDIIRLQNLLGQLSEKSDIVDEIKRLRRELREFGKFGSLIGKSELMKELFRQIEIAAPTGASVLINGESGTGKELVARAIHDMSPRRAGSFIAINCSAIPPFLLESEIFGYDKGAFTGANRTKEGCYELAHNGTLFLDEISEMATELQSKLLRVLEDGTFRRIGGKQELRADVRLVAASNTPFKKALAKGKLREDLYYRLNVFCLELPSLQDRPEDIPLLVQYFINEFNRENSKSVRGADAQTLQCLQSHIWPGNVRELRNIIERAVIVAKQDLLTMDDMPTPIKVGTTHTTKAAAGPHLRVAIGSPLKEVENRLIQKTLELTRGNKTAAARKLGITVKTLHNKLARL